MGMTPAEVDAHIRSLGDLMAQAHEAGNRSEALQWQQAMYQAIAARSGPHQEAMDAGIMARIDADPCYFCAMGELHREQLTHA